MSHPEQKTVAQLVASLPPISASSVLFRPPATSSSSSPSFFSPSSALVPGSMTPAAPNPAHPGQFYHPSSSPSSSNPLRLPLPHEVPQAHPHLQHQAYLSQRPLTAHFLKTQSFMPAQPSQSPHQHHQGPQHRPTPHRAAHPHPRPPITPGSSAVTPQGHHQPSDARKPKSDAAGPILFKMKLETEEEIAAWIAARKKNWPSAKNVEAKAKVTQGSRQGQDTGKQKPAKRKSNPGGHEGREEKRTKIAKAGEKSEGATTSLTAPTAAAPAISTTATAGSLASLTGYGSSDEGEDEENGAVEHQHDGDGTLNRNGLEGGGQEPAEGEESDDNLEEDEEDDAGSGDGGEVGESDSPSRPNRQRSARKCKFFARGRCRKGAQCPFSHEKPQPLAKKPPAPKRSLLSKLLEKDIKNRNDVILQCLHHIVQNNFFS